MSHLLVTNDFPPKFGGIQRYLFDLWSRLDPERFVVVTHDDPDAARFDAEQPFRVIRLPGKVLLPTRALRARIDELAHDQRVSLVVLDPALPLGALGPSLSLPYAVVLHGAEITVPARIPIARGRLRRVLEGASLLIAAGGYPIAEARAITDSIPSTVLVPPGVDANRFHPLGPDERRAVRRSFGLPEDDLLLLSVSRLVPRKGLDVLIEAGATLKDSFPQLTIAIGGTGRDEARLRRLAARLGAPVRMLGRISESDLPRVTACSDVVAMLCRDRWFGLEQEGFGIVFLEAGASGVMTVAGRSGGSEEAVLHGRTGLVVDRPGDAVAAASVLREALGDGALRTRLANAARTRVIDEFDQEQLASRLGGALGELGG